MDSASVTQRTDVYRIVTERIMAQLERGVIPWQRPWSGPGTANAPRNLSTGRPYRGVNVFILASLGYSSPWFLTYRQAHERGGHVRRGEHGAPVIFWKWIERPGETQDGDDTTERYAMLRYYTVFNVEQCEGIAAPGPAAAPTFAPIAECERIVADMPTRPMIAHGGSQAFYRPLVDSVQMPPRESFADPAAYYSVLFHELTHATGHASRLNRPTLTDLCPFGSTNYSKEELVAEMGAAYLCGTAGIENRTVERSAAYVAAWLRKLADDGRLVVHAAAQAQRAADFILGANVSTQTQAA